MSGGAHKLLSNVKPILYSYWLSSCAWRVRIALNLKGIAYDIKSISFSELRDPAKYESHSKVNPMMQVPALVIDGRTLIESVSIMHFLEEMSPQPPLLPQDLFQRAKVREIVEVICSGIQPMQNLFLLQKLNDEKRLEWAQYFISRGLTALEKILSNSAGKYCVGNDISMADCCLVPQLFNARRRYRVDLSPYSTLVRINQELDSKPAFVAAHPSTQPDYDSAQIKI